ncbi:MAG: hypothetical protein HWE27_03165 [Gammaproteobacteria bacterium]|nr:hypothetical protein [Gammaproteobacteria bacterium]
MKHKLSYNSEHDFFELVFNGPATVDQVLQLYFACFEHPKFRLGSCYLCDYRKGSPNMGLADMETMVEYAKKVTQFATHKYRVAALSQSPTEHAIFNIWRQFSVQIPNEEFEVFTDYDQAVAWLTE